MLTLEEIVPWGRSFEEYAAMFSLTDSDLAGRILGCGDGPASFNAQATRQGVSVISCDPIYGFTADDIDARIAATYAQVIDQARQNQAAFVWDNIASVEELGEVRMAGLSADALDASVREVERAGLSVVAETEAAAEVGRLVKLMVAKQPA